MERIVDNPYASNIVAQGLGRKFTRGYENVSGPVGLLQKRCSLKKVF